MDTDKILAENSPLTWREDSVYYCLGYGVVCTREGDEYFIDVVLPTENGGQTELNIAKSASSDDAVQTATTWFMERVGEALPSHATFRSRIEVLHNFVRNEANANSSEAWTFVNRKLSEIREA